MKIELKAELKNKGCVGGRNKGKGHRERKEKRRKDKMWKGRERDG